MTQLGINLLYILGMSLIIVPILHLIRCKMRIICVREDLYEVRDALFDVAARKECVWDPAFREAYDHIGHLTQIIDLLSVELVKSSAFYARPLRPRQRACDDELQRFIDDAYRKSALRVWGFLFDESLTRRFVTMAAPHMLRIMDALIAKVNKRRIEKEDIENFVRSAAPMKISLQFKPNHVGHPVSHA
jgi:hypothetical protein